MIGRARYSRSVTEPAGNIFTIQIHNGQTKTIVVDLDKNSNVADLLKLTTEAFGIDLVPFHQLRVAASKTGLTNSTALSSLDLASKSNLKLSILDEAPIVYQIPLVASDKLTRRLKRSNTEALSVLDGKGRNALHIAAEHCTDALKFLVRKKTFDINSRDSYGNTPLLFAARSGDATRIKFLLQSGANVLAINNYNMNSLHFLCSRPPVGDNESVEQLDLIRGFIKAGLHPYMRDSEGNAAIHSAAAGGNTVAIRYFLEDHGVHIDTPNETGETALHVAVKYSQNTTVKLLLDNRASKYLINSSGELPLDIAQSRGNTQLTCLLGTDLDTRVITQVWEIIKNSDLEKLKELASKYRQRDLGISDEQAEEQQKQLYSSVSSSYISIRSTRSFQRSNTAGDDLPYPRILNMAIFWAAARFRFELLNFLLDQPLANPNFQNSDGSFLLLNLARCPFRNIRNDPLYLEVLGKCILRGGSVNDKDADGNTALHIAGLFGNRPAAQVLLDHTAFTNTVNYRGFSELYYAVVGGNEGLISDYLRSGSDPQLCLRDGTTCIEYARRIGSPTLADVLTRHIQSDSGSSTGAVHPNVVEIKLKRGKDLLAKDDNGLSDPYCIFKHRLDDMQYVVKSSTKYATLTPEWTDEFAFVIKKNSIFYRDIVIEVFDWDDVKEGELQVDDFMGRGSIVVDPRTIKPVDMVVGLQDQAGKAGFLEVTVTCSEKTPEQVKAILDKSYKPFNIMSDVSEMLKGSGSKSVGAAKAAFGYSPRFPIMIVPGYASSALECWESPKSNWLRERVWVDPFKIGKMAVQQKLTERVLRKKRSTKSKIDVTGAGEDSPAPEEKDSADVTRLWLRHILTDADGFSDPPGIKVRPCTGLTAIDFLATSPLAKKPSYVFGLIIPELVNVGYLPKNLEAAPYDWRLPPEKLEERDGYFTMLKARVEAMKKINNERVVLLGHSMGNRCVQYFLQWVLVNYGRQWLDDTIHAFLAMGAPFLGAPKSIRAVVSGDCLGLDVFLTPEESRAMSRGSAAMPWLFPVNEEMLPDTVARVYSENAASQLMASKDVITRGKKVATLDVYEEKDVNSMLQQAAPVSLNYFNNFYRKDPNFLHIPENAEVPISPVLLPPPVQNLWVVYGINLDTEVSYYYKYNKTQDRFDLDSNASKYSGKKIAGINPRGMRISGGMAFETKNTYQPSCRANKSGDGTVPYISLSYPTFWKEYAAEHNIPIDIQIVELEGAEHREMLNHAAVFNTILDFVCTKPIG